MKFLRTVALVFMIIFGVVNANSFAQIPQVTIQQIQTVDPDSLAKAVDASPLLGDTVTTVGVVYAPPALSSSVPTGDAKMFIMDVASGVEFSGLNIITLGGNGNLLAGFQIGDSIKVMGTVSEFSTQTQVVPTEPLSLVGFSIPPLPVVIDPADLGGTTQDTVDFATAEKWETVLVKIENVTVVNDAFDAFSSWVVEDAQGNQVIISSDSDSMRTVNDSRGTGNVDPSNAFVIPAIGTQLEAIVGYVDSRFGTYSINPRFPTTDIIFGAGAPPIIANHNRNPVAPTSSEGVEVTVEISDIDGTVTSATLTYAANSGGEVQVPMTPTTGDSFSAVIPAQPNGALVTYFIQATDNDNNENILPTGAPATDQFLYYVRDEGVLIRDLQMNPFGRNSGYSGLNVTVSGIAVSDSSDYVDRFFLQQGAGLWNGITVFVGFGNVVVGRGDSVKITGRVTEFRDLTEIDNLLDFSIISKGNALPLPVDVSTGDVNTNSPEAEGYESVLVRVSDVTITNANPDAPRTFGEFLVDDGSGALRVDDRGNFTYTTTNEMSPDFLPVNTKIQSLTGPLNYANDDFKLIPRNNNDFQGIVVVSVDEVGMETPESFTLLQNYPNPFNPETTIKFRLGSKQQVQLQVYNILGQLVRTLVDEPQLAGEHKIVWDGKNERGQSLPSGLYVYRLVAGDFEKTHKMILLK